MLMGALPQSVVEIAHGARRVDLLGDVSTAFGSFAKAAFVLWRDFRFQF
jgi:hypothetical protein